jgi:tetratricopeptide (TPR) repeat protein
MIDKSAIIKSAQKFTAKGQIDKAISEWEKLLQDRKDGNVHNTIGDLYLRKGSDKQALEEFAKAAEIFKKDGFFPKAIAIYKKVLNIAPSDVDALIALAKLNAEKGLTGNAIENYYKAAEIYNRDGQPDKATTVVEKMLKLSPSDIGTRSKIAYLYFRIGHRERAANEYASIATSYLDQDNYDNAQEYYDKAIEYDPACIPGLIGMSRMAEKQENPDQAFQYLEEALTHDPGNRDVLLSYSTLALNANKPEQAKEALLKLSEEAPSDMQTKRLLGTLYLNEGQLDAAWDELLPCIDAALDEAQWSEAQELLNHFPDMHPLEVKQRTLRICRANTDNSATSNVLNELSALYEKEGSDEEALRLYKEAVELNPENSDAADKVKELEIRLGIAQQPEEPVQEALHAAEEDTAVMPEYNEVNLQETSPVTAERLSTDEIDIAPVDPGIEPVSAQYEISLEDSSEAEGSIITPAEQTGGDILHTTEAMSPEDFEAKKTEADFFAQQGLDDEAAAMYEALLAASPGNEEITRKLTFLKSQDGQTEEVPVQNVQEEKPPVKSSADDDLQALFNTFGTPAEEKVDYEAHYAAGLEFKQKGLVDEAIKELQIAVDDPDKKHRNTTMLALCYMDKGSYPLAITEFNKVIESMSSDESTYLHVKYELANAHMSNKDNARALELFSEVQSENPDFKDVNAKMASLKIPAPPADKDKTKTKRDRVSYI